ncbi:transglutaminase domain-containing protein [Halorubellus sp. JP-L1]|uniref:transglutaminase domain-containing protein n=1 Tax=Halorubellus sp. JP-L1 TaxID=2715753 RepID=UPI001407DD0D|nr:transglutaminase domain-containing protein [Halorubellus sp. JP-L1]NHN43214.1 transglutaminase domain-containing protein [Halorubellus sp. JP-L1]
MTTNTEPGDAGGGGGRRVGQVVVVGVCVLSLVLAGAIAPSLGSPFEDGPAVNASDVAGEDVARALQNGSGESVPRNASQDASERAKSASESSPSAVGSPNQNAVGGSEPLSNFSEQSDGIQFVVQAPENTYYRVGAYQSFDGFGWSRSGDRTAFSGAVPGATPPGSKLTARVTLNTSAYAVPVPWKPRAVDGSVPLSVRETGGIVPHESLRSNDSFTVTAVQPTRDPSVLAESGYDYPRRIEDAYLDVDENVSSRVESLATRVTADEANPYAEARAIESWLEANKEYSLNATTDPSEPVTHQFLFEMGAGYCQYFASSMAVMLRSQGIPARYVVGYAPGTPVGEETYAVTGSKAHAWVEAYFEGVGWVRFDPTPASSREDADRRVANETQVQQSFQSSNLSESVNGSDFEPTGSVPGEDATGATGENATETGGDGDGGGGDESGGSEDGDGSGGDGDGGDDSGEDDDGGDESGDDSDEDDDGGSGDDPAESPEASSVNVSLNRTAAPGVDVTVTVTRGGEPVSFATVYFDDEYVGRTNHDGEVVGTIPYTRNLTVRVEDVNESTRASVAVSAPPGRKSSARAGGQALSDVRFAADPVPSTAFGPPDNETNETTKRFEVAAEMTFALADEAVPGESAWLQVSIEGRPVADARVAVDGESMGTTNATGWVRVTFPANATRANVSAKRGEVRDETTVDLLTEATVRASGSAVPGADLRVTATFDDDALSDAVVSVNGDRVTRTDEAGMATVTVPTDASDDVTVAVERGVVSGSTTKSLVTDATIEFDDPPSPGASVEVLVTAANESVEGATVRVAGERAGETDRSGLAKASIPGDATGTLNVSATLGALSATREVDLYEPNVTVTPAYLVALPGAPATVNVSDAGRPVAGASVAVGESRNWTDANGTVEVGVPMRNAVTVEASTLGATASTRLDWLFANLLAVVLVGAAVVVVGLGSVFSGGRLGRVARGARRLLRRVGHAAMNALFVLAGRVDDFVSWLPTVPGLLREFLEELIGTPVRTARALAARLRAWLYAVATGLVAWLAGLPAWVRGLFADDAVEDEDGGDAAPGSTAARGGPEEESALLSLTEAWRVLVSIVSPSRVSKRTPAEIGRMAVQMGLPDGPVETLTATYQRAVYGASKPGDDEVAAASDAARSLESTAGEGGAAAASKDDATAASRDDAAAAGGDGA